MACQNDIGRFSQGSIFAATKRIPRSRPVVECAAWGFQHACQRRFQRAGMNTAKPNRKVISIRKPRQSYGGCGSLIGSAIRINKVDDPVPVTPQRRNRTRSTNRRECQWPLIPAYQRCQLHDTASQALFINVTKIHDFSFSTGREVGRYRRCGDKNVRQPIQMKYGQLPAQ